MTSPGALWMATVADVETVRLLVIAGVVALLAVRARTAWQRRDLALAVWRAIRPRHVVGALGLMMLVLTVALSLWTFVPVTRLGVGSLVGLDGNVIFAPIESALEAPIQQAEPAADGAPSPSPGVPWVDVLGVTAFLGVLVAMFPLLAHAEELAFRLGWEDLSLGRQVLSALRFGLVHLIMFIPVGAALAVGVAGFAYGRIYLATYRREATPRVVFPTGRLPLAVDEEGFSRLVLGPPAPIVTVDRGHARREAVMAATVWHATFNTLLAVIVLVGYLTAL